LGRRDNIVHRHLAKWLWPPVIQNELDRFCGFANNRRIRKQKDKILPSGITPNNAYLFPEEFSGTEFLQPVEIQVIEEILEDLKPQKDALSDWGVPPEFAIHAENIMGRIDIKVDLANVWIVFRAILSYLQAFFLTILLTRKNFVHC